MAVVDPTPPTGPKTVTILVQGDPGLIVVTDGGEQIIYKVSNGEIVVGETHAAAILGSVPGSSLKPEPPAKKAKSEVPTKE